ncbi:MAG: hypothetical protein HLUCCA04_03030 [Oceanicaulis sp. HLUCCA04]|nr:MAG: hypothetical protein HLUCCA04_03030 [Oceanicaulis sp. HLUCCA04]
MKRILFAGLAMAALSVPALAQEGQVIRMGDSALSCREVVMEANAAAEVLGGAPEGGVFDSTYATEAATSVATQAALMSGAGRAIPGISAVGGFMRQRAERREAELAAQRDVAEKRWYWLSGLYEGGQCDSRLRAEAEAEAEAAAAQTAEPANDEPVYEMNDPATDGATSGGEE